MDLSISDILNSLNSINEQCETTKNKAGYFAALYKRMTQCVMENIQAGKFEDGPRMEKLDVIFAQRYLNAYDAYFSQHSCSKSWYHAFESCTNNSLIVLQHLLIGINTHINLDLAIAAAEVAPGMTIHDLHDDFNRINLLISSLIDDVQESLAKVWVPMRILTRIANGRQIPVLNFSIDKARDASWANAVLLANMNADQKNQYISQMDATVCYLGEKIQSPGIPLNMLLPMIRASEYDDVSRTIHLIDTTIVQ
ncbi:MAG: hypothetical protein JSS67_08710 [Bacteroidetes bacterium]|nr:hypothetical protein [Bacteroidota bacterium]